MARQRRNATRRQRGGPLGWGFSSSRKLGFIRGRFIIAKLRARIRRPGAALSSSPRGCMGYINAAMLIYDIFSGRATGGGGVRPARADRAISASGRKTSALVHIGLT
jgi:hypothetical protein